MKFSPRALEGNVNVSPTHPLVELAWLAGGLAALIGAAYLVLGWAVDWVVPRVPAELEREVGARLWSRVEAAPDPRAGELAELLARVRAAAPEDAGPAEIQVVASPAVNAAALPGGRMLVFTGLLDRAGSENEVAMVLAHELGHLSHRDPLRALGRGLVLAFLSSAVVGRERSVDAFVGGSLTLGHLRYSRDQERAADRYAVETLVALYGHVGGAADLFQRLEAAGRDAPGPEFLATHPELASRVAAIEALAAERGYSAGPLTPLPEGWGARASGRSED